MKARLDAHTHTHTQIRRDRGTHTNTHHSLYIQTQAYTLIIINLLNKLNKKLIEKRSLSPLWLRLILYTVGVQVF